MNIPDKAVEAACIEAAAEFNHYPEAVKVSIREHMRQALEAAYPFIAHRAADELDPA